MGVVQKVENGKFVESNSAASIAEEKKRAQGEAKPLREDMWKKR